MYIPKGHNWENRLIKDVSMPIGSLALMIKRDDETIIPRGDTLIIAEDTLILSVPSYEPGDQEHLHEDHIEKGHDVKIDAGINRAISVVHEVDLDSLCALTVILSILNIWPVSGNVDRGLQVLDNLYSKLLTTALPKGDAWVDNLNVVGAINILSGNFYNIERLMSARLDGYICVGIKAGTKEYEEALQILERNGFSEAILQSNTCMPGYMRLPIVKISELKEELKPIFSLYSKDSSLLAQAKKNFMIKWDSYGTLKMVREWFEQVPVYFRINSVGNVLAQTNAKRCYPDFPDLI